MGYNRILPRVGSSGGSFQDKANQFSSNAINARSRMQPGSRTETEAPGKTAGGGVMAAGGGALPGYMVGSAVGAGMAAEGATAATIAKAGAAGGLWGMGIAGGVMGLAYLLS